MNWWIMYDQILANIEHRLRNPKPGDKRVDLERFKRNIKGSMSGFFGVFREGQTNGDEQKRTSGDECIEDGVGVS